MIKLKNIGNEKGMSMMELIVVMSMVGILAIIGIPQYQKFVAKDRVRRAANDLLQNSRLASTLAIKEGRPYLITFNEGATADDSIYMIGFDGNNNNSLLDAAFDGYEGGPVKVIDLRQAYGSDVVFGTLANIGPDEPDMCGACIEVSGLTVSFPGASGVSRQLFNTDGSVGFTGSVFITHTNGGQSYMLRVSYLSGKYDLYAWDGDVDNPTPQETVQCWTPPMRSCGWTEIR